MEEANEKIIVFKAYDTVMEANLAKTKLDAYGIPCFLTDEYLTNLYPIRNAIFPGVRLYIFERDVEQVTETLIETSSEGLCPFCRSKNISKGEIPETNFLRMFVSFFAVFFSVSGRIVFTCNDCLKEFDNPD